MSERRYIEMHVGNQWLVIDCEPPERTVCLCTSFEASSEMTAALNTASRHAERDELLRDCKSFLHNLQRPGVQNALADDLLARFAALEKEEE
jgi:hypothetical protein